MGVRYVYNTDRPEAHDILRHWRTVAETYEPERLLIGETNVETLERLVQFYGDGRDELHGGFNFQFMHAPFEAAALRDVVEGTEALLPDGAWPVWHGLEPRLSPAWPPAGREGDPARTKLALLMLLTLRGTPFLYQGDEIGLVDGALDAGGPARPRGRPLLALRGPRPRAHAHAVARWAGRRLHRTGRPAVAAHGRPGRRATWPTRRATPLRSSSSAAGPSRRGPPTRISPSARTVRSPPPGHLGLRPGRGDDRPPQPHGRPGHLRRGGRPGPRGRRRRARGVERGGRVDAGPVERRRRGTVTVAELAV